MFLIFFFARDVVFPFLSFFFAKSLLIFVGEEGGGRLFEIYMTKVVKLVVDQCFVDKGIGFGKAPTGEIVFIDASLVWGAEVFMVVIDACAQLVSDNARAEGNIEHEDFRDRMRGDKKRTGRSRTECSTKCGKQRRWRHNWQLKPKRNSVVCDHPLGFRDELAEHIEAANMGSRWLAPPQPCRRKVQRQQPRAIRKALQLPAVLFQRPALVQQTKASQASQEQQVVRDAVSPASSRCCSFGRRDSGLQRRGHGQRRGPVSQQLAEMKLDEIRRSREHWHALEEKKRIWRMEEAWKRQSKAKSDELDGWSPSIATRYKKSTFWNGRTSCKK